MGTQVQNQATVPATGKEALFDQVCQLVAVGVSVRRACRQVGFAWRTYYDWANKKGLSVATDKPHDSPQTGDHPDELSKGNDTSGATGCATPIPRGNK